MAMWEQYCASPYADQSFLHRVLVNAEDPAVRQARLALVQRIAALPDGIADRASCRDSERDG